MRLLPALIFLTASVLAEDTPPTGAVPEIPFERLSDRALTGLGQKALQVRAGEWKHAETEHFIYHFFDRPMASVVSVEAEFSYRVIATELGRDTSDLRLTFNDRPEGDAEAFRQFGAQDRLVEAAKGSLMLLQQAGVERQPTPIRRLHFRGDHQMRVQLRVIQS